MDNFRVETTSTNRRFVMFRHETVGEIIADADGEYAFTPKQKEKFMYSWMVGAVKAELDKLNNSAPTTITVERIDNRILVMHNNLTIGEIAQCDDGEYVFFPDEQRTGFIRLWMLEEIAAELRRLSYGQVTA